MLWGAVAGWHQGCRDSSIPPPGKAKTLHRGAGRFPNGIFSRLENRDVTKITLFPCKDNFIKVPVGSRRSPSLCPASSAPCAWGGCAAQPLLLHGGYWGVLGDSVPTHRGSGHRELHGVGEGAGGEKGKPSLRANPEPLLCCTAGAWLLKGFGTTALLQRWAGGGAGAELCAGQNWPLRGSSGHVPAVPTAGTGQGLQREAGVTGLLPFGASSQSYWNLNLKWVSGVSVQSFICFQSRFSEHELEFCQEFLKCF